MTSAFLCISFHTSAMDKALLFVKKEQIFTQDHSPDREALTIQLAQKDGQLRDLEIICGKRMRDLRVELNGLRRTHTACKETWFQKEKEYKKERKDLTSSLENKTKEKEALQKFVVLLCNDVYPHLQKYLEAEKGYNQAREEYENEIKKLSLHPLVQWVRFKKNIYKYLFVGTLSSFLLFVLWTKYSH